MHFLVEQPQQQGSGTTPRSGRSSSVSSSGSGSQAPTTRPPTPPVYRQGSTGTIGRASGSQYRTVAPPVAPAAPPQAPSPQYSPGWYTYSQIEHL